MQSDHEYESAAEDSALDESEDVDTTTKDQIKASDLNGQNGQNDNDEGILDLSDKEDIEEEPTEERGAGDGQEEKGAKVDDDEDRRNPQYIPKKGMFYEHDDRIDSEDEAAAKEKTEDEQSAKKRVPRSEATEKWGHDKFLEREQIPKSKEELVNVYGYDIRNEDNAPRARRRRRYGRGPNKYTRNWEDEEAYDSKPPPKEISATNTANPNSSSRGSKTPRGRGGRGGGQVDRRPVRNAPIKSDDQEDFPPLESKETKREQREPIEAKPKSNAPSTRGGRGAQSNREGDRRSNNVEHSRKPKHQNKSDSSANQRLQKEPRPIESSKQSQRHEKTLEAKLDKEFTAKAKIVDEHKAKDSPRSKRKTDIEENSKPSHQQQPQHQQQQQPKRYSNSRNSHNRNNNRQEYYNDMNGSTNNYVAAPQAAATHLPNSGPPPAAPFLTPQNVAATPTSTSGFLDPTTMVNYGPPPPVQFTPVAVPVTVTVPLVTAAVPPTVHDTLPVLAPPLNPNVTNAEVLLAAAAAAGATPQGYAEVRGGVTYFNPTAQPHPMMARPLVSKRPKAAIPIVDPSQVAGQASMMSPQSSTEEENESLEQQQQPQMMVASNTWPWPL